MRLDKNSIICILIAVIIIVAYITLLVVIKKSGSMECSNQYGADFKFNSSALICSNYVTGEVRVIKK